MATYEDAVTFANIVRDKNRLKAQIAGMSDVIELLKRFNETITLDDLDIVISTRNTTTDGIWDIGFSNGVNHNGNWDDAGYVWEEDTPTYDNAAVEVCRRMWHYETQTQLDTGSYSLNITVTNNDIRLDM